MSVYFERQDGKLCLQHCLNNLLQANFFTAVDLAELARDLDSAEANVGVSGEKSQNVDDDGFFSSQVLIKALQTFDLSLVPIRASDNIDISNQQALIVNQNQHWFSYRHFGGSVWYDLNSMQSAPSVVSASFLSLYLSQIASTGGTSISIFSVQGSLTQSQADLDVLENPEAHLPTATTILPTTTIDSDLEKAIAASLTSGGADDDNDDDLKKAMQASLMEDDDIQKAMQASLMDDSGVKQALQASLEAGTESEIKAALDASRSDAERDEQADMMKAVQYSIAEATGTGSFGGAGSSSSGSRDAVDSGTVSSELSQEDLRAKRLAALDRKGKGKGHAM